MGLKWGLNGVKCLQNAVKMPLKWGVTRLCLAPRSANQADLDLLYEVLLGGEGEAYAGIRVEGDRDSIAMGALYSRFVQSCRSQRKLHR